MRRASAVVVALTASCTLGAGDGFATVESAHLSAEIEGLDGTVLTTGDGVELALDAVVLEVEHVRLLSAATGEGGGEDEHDHDHGHAEESAPTDPMEAPALLAEVHFDATVDALSGEEVAAEEIAPSPVLGAGTIAFVEAHVASLRIDGTATVDGVETPVAVDAPLEAIVTAAAERPLDRDHDEHIRLHVELALDPHLFDAISVDAEGRAHFDAEHAIESLALHVDFGGEHE